MPRLYLAGDLHLHTLGHRGRVMSWVADGLFKMLKVSGSSELAAWRGERPLSPSRGLASETNGNIVTNLSTSGPVRDGNANAGPADPPFVPLQCAQRVDRV